MDDQTHKGKRLGFGIDMALACFLIVLIFFFLIMTLLCVDGLRVHAFDMRYISTYLPDADDYNAMELVEASIGSFGDFVATHVYGTEAMGRVNSGFQYLLGKRLVSTGGTQMIRLNTGHLYDLQTEMSMQQGVDDILAMRDIVGELPFLFVYEHPTLYDEEAQMPEGYGFLDYGIQEADEVVGSLREAGVNVLDSREVLPASGVGMDEYLMKTDQHWSTRGAMLMAQAVCERLGLPGERLDIEQFDVTLYPRLFLGKYGQRVGPLLAAPDDICTYTPKYPTHIQFTTNSYGNISEREGPFEEVALRGDVLKPDAGKSYSTKAYFDYGLVEYYDIMHNPAGEPCTILLLKDSFSAPIGRFLSLVARDVYSIDMRRYGNMDLREQIERSKPDAVVVAYSLQMLRDEEYQFE